MATPKDIFNRYMEGLEAQAPNITDNRITNMRIALNEELRQKDVPAHRRREADDKFVAKAADLLDREIREEGEPA